MRKCFQGSQPFLVNNFEDFNMGLVKEHVLFGLAMLFCSVCWRVSQCYQLGSKYLNLRVCVCVYLHIYIYIIHDSATWEFAKAASGSKELWSTLHRNHSIKRKESQAQFTVFRIMFSRSGCGRKLPRITDRSACHERGYTFDTHSPCRPDSEARRPRLQTLAPGSVHVSDGFRRCRVQVSRERQIDG